VKNFCLFRRTDPGIHFNGKFSAVRELKSIAEKIQGSLGLYLIEVVWRAATPVQMGYFSSGADHIGDQLYFAFNQVQIVVYSVLFLCYKGIAAAIVAVLCTERQVQVNSQFIIGFVRQFLQGQQILVGTKVLFPGRYRGVAGVAGPRLVVFLDELG